jgi:exonuclease III
VQENVFIPDNIFGIMASTTPMPTNTYRIMLYNLGYCTELDGSWRSYLLQFYRYLYTPKRVIKKAMRSLHHLMEKERPDLCCFMEIKGKGRATIHSRTYSFSDVENKYGYSSILRRLPFFRNNCNGFYAKEPVAYKKYNFKHGTKKLIYEIQLKDDISLIFAHFSLGSKTRKKQFAELKEFVAERKKVILCGDFNTFKHVQELRDFAKEAGLKISNEDQNSFPSRDPKNAIDLVLCSENIHLKFVEVLKNIHMSDHLPVMVEVMV